VKNIITYIKSNSKTLYWVLFSLILLVLIFIQYYGVVHFHYPDTPGDDTVNHWGMIQDIKNNSKGFFEVIRSGGYPPLYHFTILKISSLLHLPEMTVMLWSYPAIIVFASLAAFFLAYAVFKNKYVALLALLLYGFTTRTPMQLLHDGGYPNLIAAHILLPSAIAFLILAWKSKVEGGRWKVEGTPAPVITNASRVSSRASSRVEGPLYYKKIILYVLGGIFIVLTMLTHHISTFEMLGIAITATPILIIATWTKNKWQWWKGILWLAVYGLLLAVLGFLYFKSSVFAPFRGLASIMIVITDKFPFIKSLIKPEAAALVPWQMLPGRIGRLVVPLALIFIPLFSLFKPLRERKIFYPTILVSAWSLMLLILSQSTLFTNPERLARDSALPLSILAAGSIYYIGQYFKSKKILLAGFIVVCILLAYSPLHDRFYNAFHYEPMVRITQADLQAINILTNERPGPIITNSWVFYYEKYLPNWKITYGPAIDPTSFQLPDLKNSVTILSNYKYIYIIDNQLGWAPGVQFGIAKNFLASKNFRLLGEFNSPINHVYLFENYIYQ